VLRGGAQWLTVDCLVQ